LATAQGAGIANKQQSESTIIVIKNPITMKTHQTLMLVFTIASLSILNGCQKEPQSGDLTGQADESVYTPKAAKLVADINSFKQKMTAVREHPDLKSGEVISKEDARWNLETLFNATYGFPDLRYRKTVTDTALLYLPVDASGNALLEDVVAVYDEILTLITGFYINANFDEKGFLFMQLSSGDVANGELEIRLEAVTGARLGTSSEPPVNYGPFYEGDDWLYGDDYGKCGYIGNSDAAEEIQIKIRERMIAWPEAPNGFRWLTLNPFTINLEGDEFQDENGENLIFYVPNYTEDDKCLDSIKMNLHYYNEEQVIYQLVPQFDPEFNDLEDWAFLGCDLIGESTTISNIRTIRHKNKLDYTERILVPVSELPLPIEIDNEL
jgi:hypothetical protein